MLFNKKNKLFRSVILLSIFLSVSACGLRAPSSPAKKESKEASVSKQDLSRQLIVRFKKPISEAFTAEFAKKYNAKVIKSATELNSAVLEFSGDKKLNDISKTLNSDSDVDFAETNSEISL